MNSDQTTTLTAAQVQKLIDKYKDSLTERVEKLQEDAMKIIDKGLKKLMKDRATQG